MQYLLLMGIVLLLPLCVGMLPVRFMQENHKTIGFTYVTGWLVMFALFQLLAIPFIVLEQEFQTVVKLYSGILVLTAIAGLWAGRKTVFLQFSGIGFWKNAEAAEKVLWAAVILLIGLQIFLAYHMQYLDGDDAFFGATALGIQQGDGMYMKNPYYGYAQELDMRHALSPVPVWIAWLGTVTGIHATVLSHSWLGAAFLFLMYVIYGQLGKELFRNAPKNIPLFLLFLNVWYLFGNVSLYTAETFAYTRTWQGKSMFGNLIVPVLFLWLLYAARGQMKVGEWCMLFLLSAVAAMMTSTGIFLFPILMAVTALVIAVKQKNWKILLPFMLCCLPSVAYGLVYLVMK